MKKQNQLKKCLLSLVMSFFICSFGLQAQEVFPETKSNAIDVGKVFENAYYSVEKHGDYFVVNDDLKYYFDFDANNRYIWINIRLQLNDGFSKEKIMNLVNKLNTEVALIRTSYNEDKHTLTMEYYFWTQGGFTPHALINAYKLFKDALLLSLKKDTEQILK